MADTQTLNPFASKPKERITNPQTLPGAMGFLEETESALESASNGVLGVLKDVFALKDDITGISPDIASSKKPFSSGSLENFSNPQGRTPEQVQKEAEAQHARTVYSTLEQAKAQAQKFAHERTIDESIRLEIFAMPTEEKNRELHLNLDFDEKNINNPYHIHALYMKKKNELKKAKSQAMESGLPHKFTGAVNLNALAEGGTGGAAANISATGGGG